MKFLHICYAHSKYIESQKKCSESALLVGGFTESKKLSIVDIDREFIEKNLYIFEGKRGAGYWLWKPFLIKKELLKLDDGDILCYTDSGMIFIKNITEKIYNIHKNEYVGCYGTCGLNRQLCKRDAFIIMNMDNEYYTNKEQITASIITIKKCKDSLSFVDEWLYYCQDPRILTDIPNTKGLKNYPEFMDHRHDQSVFSLLCAKYKIIFQEDLTQFSNPNPFLFHHRNPQ